MVEDTGPDRQSIDCLLPFPNEPEGRSAMLHVKSGLVYCISTNYVSLPVFSIKTCPAVPLARPVPNTLPASRAVGTMTVCGVLQSKDVCILACTHRAIPLASAWGGSPEMTFVQVGGS